MAAGATPHSRGNSSQPWGNFSQPWGNSQTDGSLNHSSQPWGNSQTDGSRDHSSQPWGNSQTDGSLDHSSQPWGNSQTNGSRDHSSQPWGNSQTDGSLDHSSQPWGNSQTDGSRGNSSQPWGNSQTDGSRGNVEDGSDAVPYLKRNKYAFIVLGKNGGKAYYRYLVHGYCMTQPEATGFAHGLEMAEHQNHRQLLVQTYVMVSCPTVSGSGVDYSYILGSQIGFGMFADVPIPDELPEAFKINPHDSQELNSPLSDDDTTYMALAWHL